MSWVEVIRIVKDVIDRWNDGRHKFSIVSNVSVRGVRQFGIVDKCLFERTLYFIWWHFFFIFSCLVWVSSIHRCISLLSLIRNSYRSHIRGIWRIRDLLVVLCRHICRITYCVVASCLRRTIRRSCCCIRWSAIHSHRCSCAISRSKESSFPVVCGALHNRWLTAIFDHKYDLLGYLLLLGVLDEDDERVRIWRPEGKILALRQPLRELFQGSVSARVCSWPYLVQDGLESSGPVGDLDTESSLESDTGTWRNEDVATARWQSCCESDALGLLDLRIILISNGHSHWVLCVLLECTLWHSQQGVIESERDRCLPC
jgi:hypothetical protein